VVIGHDITERKKFEEALRQSEERYRLLAETMLQGVVHQDGEGKIIAMNPAAEQILGKSREEFLGSSSVEEARHTIRQNGEPFPGMEHPAMVALRTCHQVRGVVMGVFNPKVGDYRWIMIDAIPVCHPGETRPSEVYTVFEDITERRQAEEALRRSRDELEIRVQERTRDLGTANEELRHLSSRLMSAQEEERKRFAAEIHDAIGSCLSAIKFKVEAAVQQIGETAPGTTESLNTIIPVVQESINECRRIQMDLRPAMLDDLGLLPTLSWFCRRFQTIYSGIRVEQEIAIQENDIPQMLKIVVFRIIQEAMNNIAKHSRANLVSLSLNGDGKKIELAITDNGTGFDVENMLPQDRSSRGLGLESMRERADLSGGSFTIQSARGKGTVIRASWPAGPQYS
jgi:PAS domain S-box-containing protein